MAIRLIAMDLDGTLTQHRTPISDENLLALRRLSEKFKLIMVGAGGAKRIFEQLRRFPIDILGNYGMEYGEYDESKKDLTLLKEKTAPCDREKCESAGNYIREKYGYTSYAGDSIFYHNSGCVTLALLGTDAKIEDKIAFDPKGERRKEFYSEVCRLFPDYNVFIGGSSSFDMTPRPNDKRHALSEYCLEKGYRTDEVVFIGDEYGVGGNDECVYKSDFRFITTDNYLDFPKIAERLLEEASLYE